MIDNDETDAGIERQKKGERELAAWCYYCGIAIG